MSSVLAVLQKAPKLAPNEPDQYVKALQLQDMGHELIGTLLERCCSILSFLAWLSQGMTMQQPSSAFLKL